jgi:hypothetical protein
MTTTEQLIDGLSGGLQPVRPLRKPWVRAGLWSGFATAVVAAIVLVAGVEGDLAARLGEATFLMPLAGSWLTGVAAAFAAFAVSLPDRSRRWLWLPVLPVLLWGTGFAYGCLANWVAIPADLEVLPATIGCLLTIVLTSAGLLAVLLPMLRRVRTLRPRLTAWLGCLAIAGFADTAHILVHSNEQASLLALAINLVPALVLVVLGGLAGRRIVA